MPGTDFHTAVCDTHGTACPSDELYEVLHVRAGGNNEPLYVTERRVTCTIFDMQAVCDHLNTGDIPAFVGQSGGGVATLYAGEPWEEPGWGARYPAIAGPGWFEGPNWTKPRASTDEFYIGPDDDGVAKVVEPERGASTERIAELIAQCVRRSS